MDSEIMESMVLALANTDVLRWARETAGLDVFTAAEKIGVTPEKLEAVEAGEERLTFPQLRVAASVYRRAIVVFYLPRPPEEPPPVADFRRVPEYLDRPWSPELRLATRRLSYKRDAAVTLIDFAGPFDWGFVGSVSPGHSNATEKAAAAIRKWLPAPTPDGALSDERQIFSAWRSSVEAKGVLVFLVRNVQVEEMRGMSIARAPLPAIALNRADSVRGRLFSLVHELVHVHLGMSSMCDDFSEETPSRNDYEVAEIETFCNAVAGAVLMPAQSVRTAMQVRAHPSDTTWTEGELKQLAAPFGVSAEAMLRRLLTLELATEENYRALRGIWRSRPPPPDREGFGEKGHLRVLRTHGLAFVRIVLDALGSDAITFDEVADFLDMKLNHLQDLAADVAAAG